MEEGGRRLGCLAPSSLAVAGLVTPHMRYRELGIQTLRNTPAAARSFSDGLLTRAGYIGADGQLTALGARAIAHLEHLAALSAGFLGEIGLPSHSDPGFGNVYFCDEGEAKWLACPRCHYAAPVEVARCGQSVAPAEALLPLERVATPNCHTIKALAAFLGIPPAKTAKALMYVRSGDRRFVMVVIRGDRQVSSQKLLDLVGSLEPASPEDMGRAGAAAGYASPVGLSNAMVIVDQQVFRAANLVAGANEAGFHLRNVNYGRDYQAEFIGDVILANSGDPCPNCGENLSVVGADGLADQDGYQFRNILRALATEYHDDRGLCWPPLAAPFDVHLIQLPSKNLDTAAGADDLYQRLEAEGIGVLYDDRKERAGVKFNDADLIGLPIRITVAERGLERGMIEFKVRRASEVQLVPLADVGAAVRSVMPGA